ncbi:50S ribosomal protein L4 [Candidatus Pacearchaeota archaeon]|jgi:large subunit ribosomal protein L4e|nr:50S ribosomal protein L4 [Candidatus Pacearchaeota archaeon]|tara:strand:+ start:3151 stop:3945 length:795 start_codon:yes stop_codon:yes gene_type:complete
MKANILDITGKEKGKIDLPKCFSQKVREDILSKVLEAKKTKQPYSPSPVAGKQHSAKGKVIHRRHVWRSGYGRGASRVPRKIMSSKGSQFNWEAAEIPFAKGGMRAHPPKVLSMINTKKINKKELKIALFSAISATANEKKLIRKYERLNEKIDNLPLIVESSITSLKAKELISSLKKILGKQLFDLALQKKKVRAGIGKMRGRKYKKNAGLLLVIGNKEKLQTNAFDIVNTGKLSVTNLAKGGSGRLTLYTEQSIKELGERFK